MIAVSHSEVDGDQKAISGPRQDVLLGLIRRPSFRMCVMDISYVEGGRLWLRAALAAFVPTALCSFEHVAFTFWAYLSFLLGAKLAELRLMLL